MTRLVFLLILGRILTLLLPSLAIPSVHWNNWDAPHFLYLAEHGYTPVGDEANFIVFPPLYPLAIRAATLIIPNYEIAAILVSNIAFIIGGIILFKLVSALYSRQIAGMALFLLHIFPTSYFFSAPYTESLFFLLTVTALWFAHKKQWMLAGAFGGLSFLTRHPGLFLLPAMMFLAMKEKEKIKNMLLVTVPFGLCVAAYLGINFAIYRDPLAFQKILQNHWHKNLAWPWEGLRGSWLAARGGWEHEYSRMLGIFEAVPATLSLIAIPFVWKMLKEKAYALWYTITVIFLCSTSFLMSTPRYLLSIPPLFIFLALVGKKLPVFYYVWIVASASLFTYLTLLYVRGQWAF